MNERQFHAMLSELVEENPFAVRALLQILSVEFTDEVPTLAVTTGDQPRLLVNLEFIENHCKTEAHVKAVICHEFLHVLLRHTERMGHLAPADHLAMDAVINAIIHRSLGEDYSDMMKQYYASPRGLYWLLRPPTRESVWTECGRITKIQIAWCGLYTGQLVADDIRDLARDFEAQMHVGGPREGYLGNHEDQAGKPVSAEVEQALDRAMKGMNGDGIWRAPKARGVGANAYRSLFTASSEDVNRWRRATYAVLRKHLTPDSMGPRERTLDAESMLPVLHPADKRSFMRAIWSPLIPDAVWPQSRWTPGGTAQVYLDVSGSMNAEMPLLVSLLGRLASHIRRPFWAFSNVVAPARIHNGTLQAETTGGTSMGCVLEHVARTAPPCAVVITDGYIEHLPKAAVKRAARTRIHALVTRDGDPSLLHAAGIPYTQLGRLPR
jgi:hypothetical protein